MQLVVKHNGSVVKNYRFKKGPVYIGRHSHSQVFFPDPSVSRQHAVIFVSQDGSWVVEDLDSANKTFLNGKAIHKSKAKTGDVIKVGDYEIAMDFQENSDGETAINLEDTLSVGYHHTQVLTRKPGARSGPSLKMPVTRINDYVRTSEILCQNRNTNDILKSLLEVILSQFSAYRVWAAIRKTPQGPMNYSMGRTRSGSDVELTDIPLQENINQAVEKKQFMLAPRVAPELEKQTRICSVLIAPMIGPGGVYGVIYLDNILGHERYSISDLDYLLFVAIHAASVVACRPAEG